METFSTLLAICAGNSPVAGEFPAQRPVTRSFDVFFDLHLNKRLSKQWWGWWFETLSRPLWRHCNGYITPIQTTKDDPHTSIRQKIDCRLRHNASTHPYHCDASTWNAISNLLDIYSIPLRWRHNDHTGVSNHQPHGCLLNRLFRLRSKKTSKLRVTGLCAGNSPGPVNSPHKGPVTRKMFPFDDVIMHGHIHGRSWKYLGHWYYSPPNWCQISWITQILHGHRFFIRAKAWLGRAKYEFHK